MSSPDFKHLVGPFVGPEGDNGTEAWEALTRAWDTATGLRVTDPCGGYVQFASGEQVKVSMIQFAGLLLGEIDPGKLVGAMGIEGPCNFVVTDISLNESMFGGESAVTTGSIGDIDVAVEEPTGEQPPFAPPDTIAVDFEDDEVEAAHRALADMRDSIEKQKAELESYMREVQEQAKELARERAKLEEERAKLKAERKAEKKRARKEAKKATKVKKAPKVEPRRKAKAKTTTRDVKGPEIVTLPPRERKRDILRRKVSSWKIW